MYDLLFDNYLTVFGGLVIFLALGAVVGVAGWRTSKKMIALEQKLAGTPHLDSKDLYELLHSAVAHEFDKNLESIMSRSQDTLRGLTEEQLALREKQKRIFATASNLKRRAENILALYEFPRKSLQPELLNIRHLVERVLVELQPFAENEDVRLIPSLIDIEPVLLDRDLTLLSLENVIHNAIQYSDPGRVVKVTLSLNDKGPEDRPGKWIWIDVKDAGKGIKKEDWDKIFQPGKRGDGLIEPGSGLGLYLAREAARRQGGDVKLASSVVNEGSTFRIILPYNSAGEVVA